MGRHKKIDSFPIDLVEGMRDRMFTFRPRWTYQQIADWLNGELTERGIAMSYTTAGVGGIGKYWRRMADRRKELELVAEQFAEKLKDTPGTNLVEMAEAIYATQLVEHLVSSDIDFDMDGSKLGRIVAEMSRSKSILEKLKLDFRKEFDKEGAGAFGRFFRDLLTYLGENDPEASDALSRNFDDFINWAQEKYVR